VSRHADLYVPMKLRVLLCASRPILRTGLRVLIEQQPDMEIVGEVADGPQAVVAARRRRPDVALVEYPLPIFDGMQVARQLARSAPRTLPTIIVSASADERKLIEAFRAGARGFLLADGTADELVFAIRAVAAGGTMVTPAIAGRLLHRYVEELPIPSEKPTMDGLTSREVEILCLLARGQSNAEIAERLCLSEATVKSHLHHLLQKLGLRDRVQAVVLAYQTGLVRPGWAGGQLSLEERQAPSQAEAAAKSFAKRRRKKISLWAEDASWANGYSGSRRAGEMAARGLTFDHGDFEQPR
jgi:DNA-binding NarL/FixJ family response regulator